jgi:hypothetical protein
MPRGYITFLAEKSDSKFGILIFKSVVIDHRPQRNHPHRNTRLKVVFEEASIIDRLFVLL